MEDRIARWEEQVNNLNTLQAAGVRVAIAGGTHKSPDKLMGAVKKALELDLTPKVLLEALSKASIKIDDVDPTCPCLGERHRLSDGIIAVHRLTSVVALVQAHTSAASKVDRREQLHQGPATVVTKFRRMRMPSAPDFSGWNWHAHRLSRATAATRSVP